MIGIGDLQIDNQMFGHGNYDFPVMLLKQSTSEPTLKIDEAFFEKNSEDRIKELQKSFVCVCFSVCTDVLKSQSCVEKVNISAQPGILYLEDTFVYDTLRRIDRFMPTSMSVISWTNQVLPKEVKYTSNMLSKPIRLQDLVIQPIKLELSIHASLKLFIASDNTPLAFGRFEKSQVVTTSQQFVRSLVMHYASGALFRAGKYH